MQFRIFDDRKCVFELRAGYVLARNFNESCEHACVVIHHPVPKQVHGQSGRRMQGRHDGDVAIQLATSVSLKNCGHQLANHSAKQVLSDGMGVVGRTMFAVGTWKSNALAASPSLKFSVNVLTRIHNSGPPSPHFSQLNQTGPTR